MTPEDVNSLLHTGLNYRQILGVEETAKERTQANAAQNIVENYYKQLNANLAMGKDRREATKDALEISGLKRSAPYSVDGKEYIDWTDAQGNRVKREELGASNTGQQNAKLLRTPDGKIMWAKPGDNVPDGSTYLSDNRGGLTFDNQKTLAGLDMIFATGKDSKGTSYDPEALGGFAELYNKNHPSSQMVKIPGQVVDWGPDKDPQWIKLPKDPIAIIKMPDETVISRDSKTGQEITVKKVKEVAKAKGASPEAVLKFLGIGR